MLLSWTSLAFLLLAAGIVWFWQDSLAVRERANAAAIEACERLGLQFLDGTVAFARLGWTRGPSGSLTLRRTYVFDYTATSIERHQGFVVLCGHRVETVGYAPGHSGRAPARPAMQAPTPTAAPVESNVLQLDHWRTQHRPPQPPQRENREESGDPRH